jgi:hypothetical protein
MIFETNIKWLIQFWNKSTKKQTRKRGDTNTMIHNTQEYSTAYNTTSTTNPKSNSTTNNCNKNSGYAEARYILERKYTADNKVERLCKTLSLPCYQKDQPVVYQTTAKVMNLFDHFVNFKYCDSTRQLNSGKNARVNEIYYKRHCIRAAAILKIAKTTETDNLFMEYVICMSINHLADYFPCFIRTYGLFLTEEGSAISNRDVWYITTSKEQLSEIQKLIPLANSHPTPETSIPIPPLTHNRIPFDPPRNQSHSNHTSTLKTLTEICISRPELLSILQQSVTNSNPFDDYLKTVLKRGNSPTNTCNFFRKILLDILLQLYAPLYYLRNDFTHNDLHPNNILIQTLEKPVLLVYHLPIHDQQKPTSNYTPTNASTPKYKTIKLETRYIAKMIDYARSYISPESSMETGTASPIEVWEWVCDQYGYDKVIDVQEAEEIRGFDYCNLILSENNYFTSSLVRNMSQDLRLLANIKCTCLHAIKRMGVTDVYVQEFANSFELKYKEYGTPEDVSGSDSWPTAQNRDVTTAYKPFISAPPKVPDFPAALKVTAETNMTTNEKPVLKNVSDAFHWIRGKIEQRVIMHNPNIDELHIYPDKSKPMEWIYHL